MAFKIVLKDAKEAENLINEEFAYVLGIEKNEVQRF